MAIGAFLSKSSGPVRSGTTSSNTAELFWSCSTPTNSSCSIRSTPNFNEMFSRDAQRSASEWHALATYLEGVLRQELAGPRKHGTHPPRMPLNIEGGRG